MLPPQRDDGSDVLTLESGLEALRSSPEFRGPVEELDDHDSNGHLALIYENQAEQFAAAVPFIRQGLRRGERCLYVADENSRAEVVSALRAGGVDVDAALDSGALSIYSKQDTYLREGKFDPDDMIEFLADAIDEATETYEALRIAGEMTWVFGESPDMEDLIEYEGKVNRLMPEEDCIALCQYNRERFPTEVIRDVVRTHPHLIYDGTVCQNFYYTPPEDFFGPTRPEREIDRMMETLTDRTEAKTALQERERYQRELYEIMSHAEASFEEKLQSLFDFGCERFGLEIGGMARIDPESDLLEVERVSADHEFLVPGARVRLSESYCRIFDESGQCDGVSGPVGISDPVDSGFEDARCYEGFGVKAYLGTRLPITGGLDRTLFFASSEPRDEPFSDEEQTFLDLMGQWVSYELEHENRERFLRNQNEITASGDLTFDEKIDRLLELGCERFEADIGMLTHEQENAFEIEKMHGDHPELEEGVLTPPMTDNYCRRVVDDGESICVADAGEAGWGQDALYEEFDLQCYAGTEIAAGDETYGTVCFTNLSPREREFSAEERTFLELMGQWVSYELEREQREDRLAALNDLTQELMNAETGAEVSDYIVDAASDHLDLPVATVALYDPAEGSLDPKSSTERAADLVRATSAFEVGEGIGWQAFAENEQKRATDPLGESDESLHPGVTEVVAVPLGNHGVFLTGATGSDGFTPSELDFAETVAGNVNAALDRASREQQLHEREDRLEEQNESLERLERINTTIRRIDQALVSASGRAEIAEVVCHELADAGPYELAWFGKHDPVTDEITPRTSAGAENGYLGELREDVDETVDGDTPADRATRTRTPQVVNEILDDPPFEPWRRAALSRGYHAVVALPLVHEDTLFGVLNIYAGESGVFDDLERTVLAELSDTIAYAINAAESKKALVSNEVTELVFSLSDADHGVVDFVDETGCEFAYENTVPQADGRLRGFFTTRGVSPEIVREHVPDLSVDGLELLSERTDHGEQVCLFEGVLTEESLPRTVLEHGGIITEFRATGDDARVEVHVAADAAIREFVSTIQTRYSGAEIVAKRTRERPERTPTEFHTVLTDELTARQSETLQTAYFSGYFENPRTRNGSEIAESMDISQPTFNNHLRTAQRKLYRRLFEQEAV
jgi:GAF domain-containing protein/predicted DNA binding protein